MLLSRLVTWHTNWHADDTFTWKLSGQVSWGIYRIAFVLLFDSPLEALFDSDYWSNLLQLIVDTPLGSKVRYPDSVGSPLQATLAMPPSRFGLRFTLLASGACTDSPSQAKLAVTFSGLSHLLETLIRKGWQDNYCQIIHWVGKAMLVTEKVIYINLL